MKYARSRGIVFGRKPLYLCLGLILWCTSYFAQCAPASEMPKANHLSHIEAYVDESSALNIDDIEAAPFTVVDGLFSDGFQKGTFWFRITVKPAADDRPLFLRIRPNNRNELTLYEPDAHSPGSWRTSVTGNSVPWLQRATATRGLGFYIDPEAPTTYYLKMNSAGVAVLEIDVLDQQEAIRQELVESIWLTGLIALMVAVMAWGFYEYAGQRDPVILSFSVALVLYVLALMATQGLLAPIIPHKGIAEVVYWFVALAGTASLNFHRLLLVGTAPARILTRTIDGILIVSVVAVALVFMNHQTLGLGINSALVLFASPIFLVTALSATKPVGLSKRTLVTHYALWALVVFTHLLPIFNFVDSILPVPNGIVFYGVASSLLFGHLLHTRSRTMLRNAQASKVSLEIVKRELDWHGSRLKENERFFAMLTHEMKNPLASIRFTLDAFPYGTSPETTTRLERIGRAVRSIDELVDQCVLIDQIEQGRVAVTTQVVNPTHVIEEILLDLNAHDRVSLNIGWVSAPPQAIRTDGRLLKIALKNLIDNALKYGPYQQSICVELSCERADGLEFRISNLIGPAGRPDESALFTKYQRGKHTQGYRGTGLGLYLVQWIAQRLGGNISLRPSQTSVIFSLWIPVESNNT